MASKNVGSERKREPICAAKAHGTSQRAGGRIELKSENLQYNTMGRWDKWLINQVSDVPSIIFFFIISHRLRALKTLYFHFCKVIEKIERNLQEIVNKIIRRNDETIVPSTHRIILKIVVFLICSCVLVVRLAAMLCCFLSWFRQ